jgi:SAM-dependent methyltransferase
MHKTSYDLMTYFVKKYLPQNSNVLDFGGSHINGSYKDIITTQNSIYETLDWDNADYVVKGYDWTNVPKKFFDAIISGQAFEHDLYFWKTLENINKTVKNDGLVIIIVPTKGDFHQYPVDCYRFYPDSALVFAELLNAEILEVIWNSDWAVKSNNSNNKNIIFKHQFDTFWGDLGMVFKLKKQ